MSPKRVRKLQIPEPSSPLKLSQHQNSLYKTLAKVDQKCKEDGLKIWGLHHIYVGALCAMDHSSNPDRFAQAANSFRELMEKLAWSYGTPTGPGPTGGSPSLKAMVNEVEVVWRRERKNSTSFANGVWSGNLDSPAQKILGKLDDFFQKKAKGL